MLIGCARRGSQAYRSWMALKSRFNIIRQHSPPCWPVMSHICSPDIELIVDPFIVQYSRKSSCGTRILIITTPGKYMYVITLSDVIQIPVIFKPRHVVLGWLRLYLLVSY